MHWESDACAPTDESFRRLLDNSSAGFFRLPLTGVGLEAEAESVPSPEALDFLLGLGLVSGFAGFFGLEPGTGRNGSFNCLDIDLMAGKPHEFDREGL